MSQHNRVLIAIRRQGDDSERLIGWMQLAVVVFFGILYAASPKTFVDRQTFSLVPWFFTCFVHGVHAVSNYA